MSLIVISSDIEEVTHLSHRLLVLHAGSVSAEFNGPDYDHDQILAAAFGGNDYREAVQR